MAKTTDPAAERARDVQPVHFMERLGSPMLQGPEPTMELPAELTQNVLVTQVDKVVGWARKSSLWPVAFGLA